MRWVALVAVGLLLAGCETGEQRFDTDGDGYEDAEDCGPADPTVYLGADDPHGDGIDQDCDGGDGVDFDRDGYPGNVAVDHVAWDCDDFDGAIHPAAAEIADDHIDQDCDGVDLICDADGDLVLAASCGGADCDDANGLCVTEADCADADADGHRVCDGDCDDADPARFPGNPELCDGLDNDCNAEVPAEEADADNDGVRECAGDCDDGDATVLPDAEELCDGLDNDCDGAEPTDDGEGDADGDGDLDCHDCSPDDSTTDALDLDGDGVNTCDGDCDDNNPLAFPGAADVPEDGVDTNCDGLTGVDQDGDEYAAYVDDCDDDDATVHPGAAELCDGIDQDCDGVPSALAGGDEIDEDGDGYLACAECDDSSADRYPGAPELCDGLDTDCDGVLDPGDLDGDGDGDLACTDCDDGDSTRTTLDEDGDGETSCATDCDDADPILNTADLDADGWTPCDGDCSDYNPAVRPGLPEVCDGTDTDCDGVLPVHETDGDGDTFIACADCDDTDPAFHPGAAELCDALDGDCDGAVPSDELDQDADGWVDCFGWSGTVSGILGGGDCDDAEDVTWPGAPEQCDLDDNDCDGTIDEFVEDDLDGDGWFPCQGDCDDGDETIHPGQWEEATDGLDSDCGGTDAIDLIWADHVLLGEFAGERTGFSVASVDDLDGDGLDDLLIGAAYRGPGATGSAYLVLASELISNDVELSSAHAFFGGENTSNYAGHAVAGVGDVDGDGIGELLVTSQLYESSRGRTYVVGGATALAGGTFGLDESFSRLTGEPGDQRSGRSVAGGDLDGDGLADVVVGAPRNSAAGYRAGRAYVVFGSSIGSGGVVDLAGASVVISGSLAEDQAGESVAVGDFDGNGVDDLAVGLTGPGHVVVFYDSTITASSVLSVDDADVELDGGSSYGDTLACAGDIDGDGLEDLLVGEPWFDGHRGAAHLCLGADLLSAAGCALLLTGEAHQDGAGVGVGGAGDVDGDGLADLVVGAPFREEGTMTTVGKSYLVLATSVASALSLGGPAVLSLEDADAAFVGEGAGDEAGGAVSSAGDVNGDGLDDLLVGARDAGGTGRAYVLLSPY
jgi:hypothetical protein